MHILSFQLNHVKTYEKSEKSNKAIWTHLRGSETTFFVLTHSQKSLSANTAQTLAKIK